MTKDELWKLLVVKNPGFAEEDSRLSIAGRGARKMFDLIWEKAHEKGVANGRALAAMEKKRSSFTSEAIRAFFGR